MGIKVSKRGEPLWKRGRGTDPPCSPPPPKSALAMKDMARGREVGSSRNLPKSLSANSETQLTGKTGHQWTQLLLQLLGGASGQLSGISNGKHVTGSWWSVQTPACHNVRDSACVGGVQWCDDSSKSPGVLKDPLCLWWYLYVEITWFPISWPFRTILHVMCIPVSEHQFEYGTLTHTDEYRCFHPASKWSMAVVDPHWTTSPSLLTNMLKFRSTTRRWVQNCTIWLTVRNNWVHWWPVLPVSCGSLLVRRHFGKFLLDPTSLLWAVFISLLIPEL